MSELSISSNCKFSSLLISDLIGLICSFILSHPLYFSYFLFFSPYLLKLFSFLSPLFLTTSLLLLAFIVHSESPQTHFTSVLNRLQQFNEDDHLAIYETVFGSSSSPMAAPAEDDGDDHPSQFGENKVSDKNGNPCVVMEEKRLENFFKILDEFERLASNVEEIKKKIDPPRVAKSDKVVEKQRSLFKESSSPMAKSQSERTTTTTTPTSVSEEFRSPASSCGGSMRREKEWERTLACKLFEERQSAGGGGEGMDSLWEAYEMEEFCKAGRTKKERAKRENKSLEKEWEEDEEEEISGQLCCLQALKMSAGKVMLGVGKPNLVKISKAIKGIGWLHKSSKNSKKVHNHRY